jgi:hypothetical protein
MTDDTKSTQSDTCNTKFIRASAIFIRATTYCRRDYMDSAAGYYALSESRHCASVVSESELMSLTGSAMKELDRIVKQRGKAGACQWVDGIEREVNQADVGGNNDRQ